MEKRVLRGEEELTWGWCWEALEDWGGAGGGDKNNTSHGDRFSWHTCVWMAEHVWRKGTRVVEEEEEEEESLACLRILICRSLSLSSSPFVCVCGVEGGEKKKKRKRTDLQRKRGFGPVKEIAVAF